MITLEKKLLSIAHTEHQWPVPRYDVQVQPHFLFIITPPFSGSTALAMLLNSSNRTMTLNKHGEGQWLVLGLCDGDRWNPDKEVDYASVKAVWLSKFQKEKKLNQYIDVVIEKSPPNMMRIENLASHFIDYSFVANNRNPYANCASMLYRNHDADHISPIERNAVLEQLAKDWLMRSSKIRELTIKKEVPLLTYENFCHNPSSIFDVLKLPEGVSDTIDTKAKIKVNDYEIQPISSQNERQISKLQIEEIGCISSVLNSKIDLLEFFGYQIM